MISIIIPVYNEDELIDVLYSRVTKAMEALGDEYEVIAVDDGSTDRSRTALTELHQKDQRWKLLGFSRNFGHQTAISAGLYYCTGEVVAVMDADLQDPPEELHRFIQKWKEGYQVVYAIRSQRKENVFKRFAYWAFYRTLRSMSSINIPLDSGDFCVMDRAVVDVLRSLPERTRFVRGLRTWAGFRQIASPMNAMRVTLVKRNTRFQSFLGSLLMGSCRSAVFLYGLQAGSAVSFAPHP